MFKGFKSNFEKVICDYFVSSGASTNDFRLL